MVLSDGHAKIREECPTCRQGRLFIAQTKEWDKYFISCEDCESEWEHPSEIDAVDPTRNTHSFERFVLVEDMKDHPWFEFILNQ